MRKNNESPESAASVRVHRSLYLHLFDSVAVAPVVVAPVAFAVEPVDFCNVDKHKK